MQFNCIGGYRRTTGGGTQNQLVGHQDLIVGCVVQLVDEREAISTRNENTIFIPCIYIVGSFKINTLCLYQNLSIITCYISFLSCLRIQDVNFRCLYGINNLNCCFCRSRTSGVGCASRNSDRNIRCGRCCHTIDCHTLGAAARIT